MTAGTWQFTTAGRTKLFDGTFDLDTDSFKMALLLSTSNIGAASTTYAGLTNEHANANGYTTGGQSITLTLAGTTTVMVDIGTDPVWTASGGSITARYAVIYEVGGNVLCYSLLDSTPADVTATDGNTFTVAANASGSLRSRKRKQHHEFSNRNQCRSALPVDCDRYAAQHVHDRRQPDEDAAVLHHSGRLLL
jgi:hypothetical protein